MGLDYEWPVIQANIQHRMVSGKQRSRQSLVSQITEAMELKGSRYTNKIRSNNVKKIAETIAFIQEAGFEMREELETAIQFPSNSLTAAESRLRETEASLVRVNRAIKATGAYLSNRNTWNQYRTAKDRRAFYLQHKRELEACNKARRELKELFPDGKAPSINELKAEKEVLAQRRNGDYERYTNERFRHRELVTAKKP